MLTPFVYNEGKNAKQFYDQKILRSLHCAPGKKTELSSIIKGAMLFSSFFCYRIPKFSYYMLLWTFKVLAAVVKKRDADQKHPFCGQLGQLGS